jgi:hypothetical protein
MLYQHVSPANIEPRPIVVRNRITQEGDAIALQLDTWLTPTACAGIAQYDQLTSLTGEPKISKACLTDHIVRYEAIARNPKPNFTALRHVMCHSHTRPV